MTVNSTLEIQRLSERSLSRMDELLDLFGEAFEDPATYGRARPGRDYLSALLAGESFIALAALKEGRVVGGLAAYELKKFEQARSEIFIYDLAVAEAQRRQGIATALIEALKPIARARGAWVIVVLADRDDAPAVAVYERLGRREEVLLFDIPLEESQQI